MRIWLGRSERDQKQILVAACEKTARSPENGLNCACWTGNSAVPKRQRRRRRTRSQRANARRRRRRRARRGAAARKRLRPPRLLTYVDAVARHGSIRKAADALNVASSALNRQILDLESGFGLGAVRTPAARRPPDRGRRGLSRLCAAGDFGTQGGRVAGRATARAGARPSRRRRGRVGRGRIAAGGDHAASRRRIRMSASMSASARPRNWPPL